MKEKIKYNDAGFSNCFNESISFWYKLNNRLDLTYQNTLMVMKLNIYFDE